MIRIKALSVCLAACVMAAAFVVEAQAIEICPASGKRHHCIHDGDSWWDNGVRYRHELINAPEISPRNAKCRQEIALGLRARDRLRELMSGGFQTVPSGKKGRYGRELATIKLPDGREAGEVLVSEDLAHWYGSLRHKGFCRRYPGVQF